MKLPKVKYHNCLYIAIYLILFRRCKTLLILLGTGWIPIHFAVLNRNGHFIHFRRYQSNPLGPAITKGYLHGEPKRIWNLIFSKRILYAIS